VNPNNKFEIYVDQSLIHSGSLLEDMTSVFLVFVFLLFVFRLAVFCYVSGVSNANLFSCCFKSLTHLQCGGIS